MRESQSGLARIGAVSYLNSKPLIEGLENDHNWELRLDYPSRLADDLAAGFLDIALIPSVEFFLNPNYRIVSDACVATHGAVLSVKLFSRVPLGQIRTLSLDEGSRTSATLVQILLAERFGVYPELSPLSMTQQMESCTSDAILLIGDRAIHPPEEQFLETWDLGEEWVTWTGLPFVFAMWVTRSELMIKEYAQELSQARDRGIQRLDQIAAAEAPKLNIPVTVAQEYLRKNLYFTMNSAESRGLNLFRELAVENGIISYDQSGTGRYLTHP